MLPSAWSPSWCLICLLNIYIIPFMQCPWCQVAVNIRFFWVLLHHTGQEEVLIETVLALLSQVTSLQNTEVGFLLSKGWEEENQEMHACKYFIVVSLWQDPLTPQAKNAKLNLALQIGETVCMSSGIFSRLGQEAEMTAAVYWS